jgi:hypothetical protein
MVVAYENGRWFTGSGFESHTMYVRADRFIEPVQRADAIVNLEGRYVLPPFGEAHTHNLEFIPSQPARLDALIRRYMQSGVFYVQNANNLPRARADLAARINRPDAPDATFANGGITGPGGHPIEIVQRNLASGLWTETDGEGGFLHTVVDAAALETVWPKLFASRPDFVKIYLLYSEEYAARLADPRTVGWRGLDPGLVPEIVRRAHRAGLRVVAHVESRADFHVAVTAGVDQIAHMPGFRGNANGELPDPSRFQVSDTDAKVAAARGVIVVTTLAGGAQSATQGGNPALRASMDELNRANLRVLLRNGVTLALGSDAYSDISVAEARYLAALGVMDNATLLRIWSETTPRAIFPNRQIGRLVAGYEASFIVLDKDPLAEFSNATQIRSAVKQGNAVTPP